MKIPRGAEPRTDFERVMVEGYKEDMIAFMAEHQRAFGEALKLATTDRQPYAWRAAWLVETRMEDNDRRVRPAIGAMLAAVPDRPEGHQRELLKILLRLELGDEEEGTLFNLAVAWWEDVSRRPSLRWFAINFILRMLEKYPDLSGEVRLLVRPAYLKALSPGIRRSVEKRLAQALPGPISDD